MHSFVGVSSHLSEQGGHEWGEFLHVQVLEEFRLTDVQWDGRQNLVMVLPVVQDQMTAADGHAACVHVPP